MYEAMAGTNVSFSPMAKRDLVEVNDQHTFVIGNGVNICETGQIGNEEEVVEQFDGAGLLL